MGLPPGEQSPPASGSLRADVPLILLAIGWLAVFFALHFVFVRTTWGQAVDAVAMYDAASLPLLETLGNALNARAFELLLVAMGAGAVLGLLRRRPWLALGSVAAVGGAMGFSQVAKYLLLSRPDLGAGWALPNSFPSGHGTAITVICLVALISAPRNWRVYLVPVAVALPLVNGAALMAMLWHRSSDVLGAVCVAVVAVLASMALLRGVSLRRLMRLERGGVAAPAAAAMEPDPRLLRAEGVLWVGAGISAPVAVLSACATWLFWQDGFLEFMQGDLSHSSLGFGDVFVALMFLSLYASVALGAVASTLLAARRLGA